MELSTTSEAIICAATHELDNSLWNLMIYYSAYKTTNSVTSS
jgi:hypothetical protein